MRLRFPRTPAPLPIQDRKQPLVAPDTVQEGGYLVIQVNSGVKEIGLLMPRVGAVRLRVPKDGRVEYRLPPQVRGGDGVVITDLNWPNPAGTTVRVLGN